jgi:ERCC4-related helicase
MIKQRLREGKHRHSSLLKEKQCLIHEANAQTDMKIKFIHDQTDYSEHPDPKVFKLAEQLNEQMKKNEANRVKWYKTFVQALETFNSTGWDSLKGNIKDF